MRDKQDKPIFKKAKSRCCFLKNLTEAERFLLSSYLNVTNTHVKIHINSRFLIKCN